MTAELRYGQRVTNEQEKAKVRLLTREVEKLEQERVELKRQFLVQAMHRGERYTTVIGAVNSPVDVLPCRLQMCCV